MITEKQVKEVAEKLLPCAGREPGEDDSDAINARACCEWYIEKRGLYYEWSELMGLVDGNPLYRCMGSKNYLPDEKWLIVSEQGRAWHVSEFPTQGDQQHLYTNDTDTVVATSLAHAVEVWESYIGEYCEPSPVWDQIPDSDEFTVTFEEGPDGTPETVDTVIPPEAKIEPCEDTDYGFKFKITATAGQWSAANEPHFLCSTEY